jgi:hypothetical protein
MASILPSITYTDFVKNPIIGILILSLSALSYLYLDNKKTYKEVIEQQELRIKTLENKVARHERQIYVRDSVLLHNLSQQIKGGK